MKLSYDNIFNLNFNISGVYRIYNKISNKSYIGFSKDIRSRLYTHLRALVYNNIGTSKYLREDWILNKDIWEFEILEETLCKEKEKYWIQELDSINNGYNEKLGDIPSERMKYVWSQSNKGISPPNKGISMSNAQKIKISEANTGKVRSKEFKEHLRKINSGRPAPWAEKPMSDETKIKISETLKSKYKSNHFHERQIQYILSLKEDGTSINEICKLFNCSRSKLFKEIRNYLRKE